MFLPNGKEKKSTSILKDRKSTRLNSSHVRISYAVFCLKKKTHHLAQSRLRTPHEGLPVLPSSPISIRSFLFPRGGLGNPPPSRTVRTIGPVFPPRAHSP